MLTLMWVKSKENLNENLLDYISEKNINISSIPMCKKN